MIILEVLSSGLNDEEQSDPIYLFGSDDEDDDLSLKQQQQCNRYFPYTMGPMALLTGGVPMQESWIKLLMILSD